MKCRHCGSSTTVKETRDRSEGYIKVRRRVCPFGHLFYTYEVDDSMAASLLKLAASVERIGGFVARAMRFHRNLSIMKRVEKGEKHSSIALDFDLSHNMVSHIAREAGRSQKEVT